MGDWDVIDTTDDMGFINSTLKFKLKCFPDGLTNKYKASFCVNVDQPLEGVDFFITYTLVVQWNTVHFMLILIKVSVTAWYLYADVEESEFFCLNAQRFSKERNIFGSK